MVASSIVQRRYFGPCLVNGPRRSRSPEHPFSHPGLHPQHTERLAACWGEMLGGPDAYSRELASVAHMVRIHSGNGPHPELDAATERCFALALDDTGIPDDERLRSTLPGQTGLSTTPTSGPSWCPTTSHWPTGRGKARSSSAPPVWVGVMEWGDRRWHLWHRSRGRALHSVNRACSLQAASVSARHTASLSAATVDQLGHITIGRSSEVLCGPLRSERARTDVKTSKRRARCGRERRRSTCRCGSSGRGAGRAPGGAQKRGLLLGEPPRS